MSGPRLKAGNSRGSERPTWFQDVRSGCQKQADYFLRIRKLQKELINREQHNLVNAMERLKQLQYPRRKPVIRNFEGSSASSKSFPIRPLNTRRDPKHRITQTTEFQEIKPLKGQVLLPNKTQVEDEADMEPFTLDEIKRIYSMLPIMNDQQIAKIVHDVRTTFPNEPSTYLLQPHLPSIPNVPRKANRRLDNRLKLLTLTESYYSIGSSSSIPQIPSSTSHHKRTDVSKDTEKQKEKKSGRRKGKKNILAFDVDPNDSTVFSNCLSTTGRDGDGEPSPSPPPNSRPTTYVKNMDATADDATSEATNNSSKKFTESEHKVVEKTVEHSNESLEKTNMSESNVNENNDPIQITDEEKKHNDQSQQEARSEEVTNAVENVETIEDVAENKSENASVIYTEPLVKITRKEATTVEN